MAAEEAWRDGRCATVAVIERNRHGTFGRATHEGRVEFGDACIQASVLVALVEVVVHIAEFPAEVLHVLVAEIAKLGLGAAPFRSVEVEGFVFDGFVATPQVDGVCRGNDAYGVVLHQADFGRITEGHLGAGFLCRNHADHVLFLFGVGGVLADFEGLVVRGVVVLGNLAFHGLAGRLLLTFPGEPVDALPYVVD